MGVVGRVALVTGATSGIVEAIALDLAGAGAHVAVAGRDRERGASVVERITAAGGHAVFVAHDAEDPASAESVAQAVADALGPVDVLVANAGTMFFGPFAGHDADAFDRAVAVNLRGPFLLARALVPGMAARGHGRVVFVSSNGATSGAAMTSLYAMSKAGLEGLMRALMAEYAAQGVTFNTVQPGLVETPLTATMLGDPDQRARMAGHHPTGRVGVPDDIAHAVAMLVDDRAGHLQSAVLTIDGGLTRAIGYAVAAPPVAKLQ